MTAANPKEQPQMKAFVVDKCRKLGALRPADVPEPALLDHDVRIRVQAASVNPLDSKLRDGAFRLFLPYRRPFILGRDVAGTVVRSGSKVTRFKPGDAVHARPRDLRIGTFAERIALHQADVAPMPGNLGLEEAASVPLVGLTA